MNAAARLVKNTAALSLAEIFSKLANFVFVAVLARLLSPADFGGYTMLMTLVWALTALADLGISQVMVREIAIQRERAGGILAGALVITASVSLLAWAGLAAWGWFGPYAGTLRFLLFLAGGIVLGNTLAQTASSALRAFERMEIQAVLNSGLLLVVSLAGLALALAGFGLGAQVWSHLAFGVLAAGLTLAIVQRRFVPLHGRIDLAAVGLLMRQALPITFLFLCSAALRWSDVLILSQVRPLEDVAVYGAAVRLIELAFVISNSASAALLPALAIRWRNNPDEARRVYAHALRLFATLGLAVAFGLTALAGPVISLVYGAQYQAATQPLIILGWTYFFQVINAPMWLLLIAAPDGIRRFLPAIGLVTLGNIVLNLVLAPRFGPVGAAGAFLLTAFATGLIRHGVSSVYFPTPPRVRTMLVRPLLAGAAMAVILYTMNGQSLLLTLPLGAISFSLFLLLSGEFKQEPYLSLLRILPIHRS
ncbi:MAG: flippase [Chloroflexota bacterium]